MYPSVYIAQRGFPDPATFPNSVNHAVLAALSPDFIIKLGDAGQSILDKAAYRVVFKVLGN
ncbi:MAG: hypothetical protein WCO52_04290 [bacterium]